MKHPDILENFTCLFYQHDTLNSDRKACITLLRCYQRILANDNGGMLLNEISMWRRRMDEYPTIPINTFYAFPNVRQLLQVMAAFPVTTSANERSFSTL